MADLQRMEAERGVLRSGGLAGTLGGVLFILVFVIVIAFVGPDPAQPEGLVQRFPDIRAVRTVENSLYLVVLILWVAHFLALYRALRGTNLAPALFGSVLGILGIVVLAAGALPHVATARISDLYHAPGASPQDRATLVLLWQATQGMFDALFVVGMLLLPVGLIALGVAMLGSPAFGRGFGGASVGSEWLGSQRHLPFWSILCLQSRRSAFSHSSSSISSWDGRCTACRGHPVSASPGLTHIHLTRPRNPDACRAGPLACPVQGMLPPARALARARSDSRIRGSC